MIISLHVQAALDSDHLKQTAIHQHNLMKLFHKQSLAELVDIQDLKGCYSSVTLTKRVRLLNE